VEIAVEATTLSDAFARIGLALFAAAVDPASVDEAEVREVRAHGAGISELLRRWLEECLYVHEVEGFACRAIEFVVFDASPGPGGEPVRLHAFLRGEPVEPPRHRVRGLIRGIGSDEPTVEAIPEGFRVRARLEV
jgi:SHS2 domain-containing protein